MVAILSLSAQRGLIILAKLSKRLTTSLILCLLGVAILSNRFFVLRQFTVQLNQNASFNLPIHNTGSSDKRTLYLAIPNESGSDLQQFPQDVIGINSDPESTHRDARVLSKFQTDLFSSPPTYIIQSALNL
jgi:hypothetical protein